MSKKITRAFIADFVLLFILPFIIYGLWGEHLDQTNYEQRVVAEKPIFSWKTIQNYPKEFEEYYNDNLPFRTQLIEINNLIDYFVFNTSPLDKVIIGKDGWLFYNPAPTDLDGEPLKDFNGENLYSPEELQIMASHLLSVRDTLQSRGQEFIVYIAPNKKSIYGEKNLPAKYVNEDRYSRGQQVADYLSTNTDLIIIHPINVLQSTIEKFPEYTFYYKTDTHWNELGAYIGTAELLKAIGITVPDLESLSVTAHDSFSGDLIKMMGLSKYLAYDFSYSLAGYADKLQVFEELLEDEKLQHFSALNSNPTSVFVIRDSFSLGMMPYLSSQLNDCYFVHRTHYTPELLQQYPTDIVVLQVIERATDHLFHFKVD